MEIQRLLQCFQDFEVIHVEMHDNEATYLLAQHAKRIEDTTWWHSFY